MFPYAADAALSISPVELDVLRHQVRNEQSQGNVSSQSSFNLAWGLVKASPRKGHVAEGLALLSDLYRTEPARRRECLYYLSLGNYRLGNYAEAKRFNDLLLEKEPNNLQAKSLARLIEQAVTREGYLGLGLVGGAAVLGGIILAGLFGRRR